MISAIKSVRTRITENFRIEVTGEQLIKLINDFYKGDKIPSNAFIYVAVPGGGDWSNTDLDINEHPVIITWTIESGTDQ